MVSNLLKLQEWRAESREEKEEHAEHASRTVGESAHRNSSGWLGWVSKGSLSTKITVER